MAEENIFQNSEPGGYGQSEIEFNSAGNDLFVISDLHMAGGLNGNNNYTGTENFFADYSLVRFLNHLQKKAGDKKTVLIINGDFVDFLRVTNMPETEKDFQEWKNSLEAIGLKKSVEELRNSIVAKEKKFGLRTNDYKSVYKLEICASGHPALFARLAQWLDDGNTLIITKGNHDLEWFWKPVRDALRMIFAKHISSASGESINSVLTKKIFPNTFFVDDKLIVDDDIYIEHGHRYENFCWPGENPIIVTGELNLPFGSFLNRYLINYIELAYPYIDNVRPGSNILPVLIREKFFTAIKVLFYYLPFSMQLAVKNQGKQALRYLWHFILVIVLPVLVTSLAVYLSIYLNSSSVTSGVASKPAFIVQQILDVVKNFAFLSLSYFFGRLLIKLKVSAPSEIFSNAKKIFEAPGNNYKLITFGHTHDPQQEKYADGKWYFNTGTWIPVFELDAADVRLDKTYTFLHIQRSESSKEISAQLMRWNDDALRSEPLVLIDRE